MMSLTAGVVVEWALGCQNRAVHRQPPRPVAFVDGGAERLVDLAVSFAHDLRAPRNPDEVRDYINRMAALAVGVSRRVFAVCGHETARNLLLCLLSVARFHPTVQLRQDHLFRCLEEEGREAELVDLLLRTFRFSG
jgi:hypothetical protein